jgi:hypothetical protein
MQHGSMIISLYHVFILVVVTQQEKTRILQPAISTGHCCSHVHVKMIAKPETYNIYTQIDILIDLPANCK